jgi:hypothetical protein
VTRSEYKSSGLPVIDEDQWLLAHSESRRKSLDQRRRGVGSLRIANHLEIGTKMRGSVNYFVL